MLKLNLLPPEEKEEISSRNALRQITSWSSTGLFCIFIFLLLLASVWLYLNIQTGSIASLLKKAEENSESQAVAEIKKQVREINGRLQYFDKLQRERKNYSVDLEKLIELIPPGIKLRSLSVTGSKITAQGLAPTRDVLLSFKEALDKSEDFQKIDSPLSNFFRETDIEFTFNFEIK